MTTDITEKVALVVTEDLTTETGMGSRAPRAQETIMGNRAPIIKETIMGNKAPITQGTTTGNREPRATTMVRETAIDNALHLAGGSAVTSPVGAGALPLEAKLASSARGRATSSLTAPAVVGIRRMEQ